MTINDAEMKQDEFNVKPVASNDYLPRSKKYVEAKNNLLDNGENFYKGTKKIIECFKEGIFPLKSDDKFKEQARHEEDRKSIRNENGLIDYNKFMELIKSKERKINNELITEHFLVQNLRDLVENLKKLKNNPEKNKELVNINKNGLSDFKNEIENMSEREKKKGKTT